MVSLTKPVEEIYPQSPVQAVKEKIKSLVIEVEKPPQNPPAVVQSTTAYKEATVTTVVKNKLHHEVKKIPLNDLTALSREELQGLTETSVKEIEAAFAIIQRVAAEGERRAELDEFWGDDYYTNVCKFHCGIFPKMAAYNKRHRKNHPRIYAKEFSCEFWAIVATAAAVDLGALALAVCHFLGLF